MGRQALHLGWRCYWCGELGSDRVTCLVVVFVDVALVMHVELWAQRFSGRERANAEVGGRI